MIDKRMAEDFQKSGAKVLFVGDPGQLPPVGTSAWFGEGEINSILNEITRQAMDSPIIRLSMDVREQW